MARSQTKPSTPRLSEAARHLVIPEGIVTTGWPQVVAKGAELGIGFDWWQDALGRVVLGKRADSKYAATVGGIVLSIPRQVGKTYFVGAVLVILCILFPGLKVVWTAHRTRTATNTFRSLQGMARRKKIAPHVSHIRTANGEQEIGFRNGSLIMFGAREQGFGRGFDELDIEVFDEAQILTEKALEDMIAATNQARHPHGALLFYMGTPPRPVDPGEAFTSKRAKALSGTSRDMVYLECSADRDADPDDRDQWAKANFSYPQRTPLESMLRLRENLTSDEAWFREAMGIWDVEAQAPSAVAGWRSRVIDAEPPRPDAIGIAVSLDRSRGAICAASFDKEIVTGGVVDVRDGVGWLAAEAVRIQLEHHVEIVLDVKGPGSDLADRIEELGGSVKRAKLDDLIEACADLVDRIANSTVQILSDPELEPAMDGARWRNVGDRRVFGRQKSDEDIFVLEALTLATWRATRVGGVLLW